MRVLCIILVLVGVNGCAHLEDENLPTLKFTHEVMGVNGKNCPKWNKIPVAKGRAPATKMPVVKMHFKSDRPVGYSVLEGALQDRGELFCVDGIHILKASMTADASGFLEIEGLGWREPTQEERERHGSEKEGKEKGHKKESHKEDADKEKDSDGEDFEGDF